MMQIETNRLLIREFVQQDLEQVHAYASDPVVATYMIWGPNSIEETEAFISMTLSMQQEYPRKSFELAVVHKQANTLIGGCGIHIVQPGQGEIGYCFHKNAWGQGFATEAAAALLDFGFHTLDLHRIYATCRPANIGSGRVMQKIGMKYEGHLREHMWHKGKWHDSYQYSILKHEYLT